MLMLPLAVPLLVRDVRLCCLEMRAGTMDAVSSYFMLYDRLRAIPDLILGFPKVTMRKEWPCFCASISTILRCQSGYNGQYLPTDFVICDGNGRRSYIFSQYKTIFVGECEDQRHSGWCYWRYLQRGLFAEPCSNPKVFLCASDAILWLNAEPRSDFVFAGDVEGWRARDLHLRLWRSWRMILNRAYSTESLVLVFGNAVFILSLQTQE